jgi:hypothetical protein
MAAYFESLACDLIRGKHEDLPIKHKISVTLGIGGTKASLENTTTHPTSYPRGMSFGIILWV